MLERILLLALVAAAALDAHAMQHLHQSMGQRLLGERTVGRRLHPTFARDADVRSLLAAPSVRGAFLRLKAAPTPTALWLPLFPYELGAYVTTLTLGDSANPQTVTGMVDTGSGIVHFPCASCSGDGCDRDTYPDLEAYDPALSASNAPTNCSDSLAPTLVYGSTVPSVQAMNCTWFQDQDSDGQIAGSLMYAGGNSANFLFFRDETIIGHSGAPVDLLPFTPLVACDYESTASSFGAGFSGIFGLNFQPGSLYSQVVSDYGFTPTLTICLGDGQGGAPQGTAQNITTHTGLLAIGAVKPSKPFASKNTWKTPLAFTANSGWYSATSFINVAVVGLYVGGVAVLNPVAGAKPLYNFFIDSGTTVLNYPPDILEPLRATLIAALQKNVLVKSVEDYIETQARLIVTFKNASRVFSDAEKDVLFPTIYFQFDGTGKVPFKPSAYLISAGEPLVTGPTVPGVQFIFMGSSVLSIGEQYTGVLGNAWMNRMFIQVEQDAGGGGNVTMSTVDHCSQVTLVAA